VKAAHPADIAPTKPAGYSGRPLLEKLGFKPPLKIDRCAE